MLVVEHHDYTKCRFCRGYRLPEYTCLQNTKYSSTRPYGFEMLKAELEYRRLQREAEREEAFFSEWQHLLDINIDDDDDDDEDSVPPYKWIVPFNRYSRNNIMDIRNNLEERSRRDGVSYFDWPDIIIDADIIFYNGRHIPLYRPVRFNNNNIVYGNNTFNENINPIGISIKWMMTNRDNPKYPHVIEAYRSSFPDTDTWDKFCAYFDAHPHGDYGVHTFPRHDVVFCSINPLFRIADKSTKFETDETMQYHYSRQFFDHANVNYFECISKEHAFQTLTESTKVTNAYRTGIYLSHVVQTDDNNTTSFNLLRCSTNFAGPTESFTNTDLAIIDKVNAYISTCFPSTTAAKLNHVLAQIYNNTGTRKAAIKSHSDKTKDMPEHGAMIAFCTFYNKQPQSDAHCASLVFRLKKCIKHLTDLPQVLRFTLHNHSLLVIPIRTNQLYTHEIVPSSLPISEIPIRMGYVIRCSKTVAIYNEEKKQVYIGDKPLIQPTDEQIKELKILYSRENKEAQRVVYPDLNFSFNQGDYMKPISN